MPTMPPLGGLDLNLLISLYWLLREEDLTAAAKHQGIPRPTMSRALDALQVAFNDPLLVQNHRGLRRTPLGTSLLAPVEKALSSIDRLSTVGEFDPANDARRFTIIVPDVVAVVLLPILQEALWSAPRVSVNAHGSERDALRDLLNGDVDLVIGAPEFVHGEIVSESISDRFPWNVVGRRDHPAYSDEDSAIEVEDWLAADHVQLMPADAPSQPSVIDRVLHRFSLERRIRARLSYVSAVPDTLRGSDLLISLPNFCADWVCRDGELRALAHPLGERIPPLELRASWHVSRHSDSAHAWFLSRMKGALDEMTRRWGTSVAFESPTR